MVPYCNIDVFYRSNININDVLGDYSLTLVDTLDTLVVSKRKQISHAMNFCARTKSVVLGI